MDVSHTITRISARSGDEKQPVIPLDSNVLEFSMVGKILTRVKVKFCTYLYFPANLNALGTESDAVGSFDDLDEVMEGVKCDYPNDCDEVRYFQEISQAPMRNDSSVLDLLKGNNNSKIGQLLDFVKNKYGSSPISEQLQTNIKRATDKIKEDFSIVYIYFKELGIIKYSKDELFGIMDVIGTFD